MGIGAFFLVINIHLFVMSFVGTKLMEQSLSIGVEITQISWYNIKSAKLQKYLTLIILRSYRLTGIKAGKFFFINFRTYTEALNAIVSYFSVLRAVLDRN